MSLDNLAFVDIETTGGSVERDRILEIAIICVKNNQVEKEFSSLVNPQMPFSPFIEMMTGIKPNDVVDAPTFEDIQHDVFDLLQDKVFIAHNVGFDYGFIKQEFKRLGMTFSADRCCTVKLSRHLYPSYRSHNLDSLIERFGFKCNNRHRAYGDTNVLWQFYQHVRQSFSEEAIIEAFQSISKRPTLPPHLDESMVTQLPERPGVYTFYAESGLPLYIGKSINVKDRVLSHFANVTISMKERDIFQQIHRVEVQETVGELGALLLESKLVKEQQPMYNKKLRKSEETYYIIKYVDKNGYYVPKIVVNNETTATNDEILGVYKTKTQAKKYLENLVSSDSLCRVLLGLEKSSSGCFNAKIGKCEGACKGIEKPEIYNEKFMNAFTFSRIQEWPYEGPIMIEDYDPIEKKGEKFLFNDWKLLGEIHWSREGEWNNFQFDAPFDYDLYVILKKHLRNRHHIKKLSLNDLEKIQQQFATV